MIPARWKEEEHKHDQMIDEGWLSCLSGWSNKNKHTKVLRSIYQTCLAYTQCMHVSTY